MVIASFVVIGVGVLLILVGLYVSLSDRARGFRKDRGDRKVTTTPLGLPETLTALQKLVDTLKGQPLGFQLIILGIVVIIVGGLIGGAAAL